MLFYLIYSTPGASDTVMRKRCHQISQTPLYLFALYINIGMTKALLSYLKREFGVKSYQIDIEFPVQSKEDIITTFQTNLRYVLYVLYAMHHTLCSHKSISMM